MPRYECLNCGNDRRRHFKYIYIEKVNYEHLSIK